MYRFVRWFGPGLMSAAVAAGGAAQTSGFVLHCLSARTAGAGCVALGGGAPTSLFRDPAGLVAAPRSALEVNLSAFTPALDFRNDANPGEVAGASHTYPMFSAGYVAPQPRPGIAWGIGLEPIGGFGSDFSLDHALLGSGRGYESFFAAMKVGPALAWEPLPGFSVGGSVALVYAQIRDFRMPFTMPPSVAAGMTGLAGLDPDHYPALFAGIPELTAYGDSKGFAGTAWTGSLGISLQPSDALRLSASWSPLTRIEMDGARATIEMTQQFQALFGALVQERMTMHGESEAQAQAAVAGLLQAAGLDLGAPPVGEYDAATVLRLPQTVAVGGHLALGGGWTMMAEGVWMQWSRAEETMPFILTGGDSRNINLLVNGDPADDSFRYPFPLDWDDSYSGKIGVEKVFESGSALRAGYITGNNPVPGRTVFIAFPAISEHSVTLGGTTRLGGVALDLAVVRALPETVGGSDGHSMGQEYVGSSTRMSQTVVTLGTRVTF